MPWELPRGGTYGYPTTIVRWVAKVDALGRGGPQGRVDVPGSTSRLIRTGVS